LTIGRGGEGRGGGDLGEDIGYLHPLHDNGGDVMEVWTWPEFRNAIDEANMYKLANFNDGESEGYRDETWNQEQFTYDPKPQEFLEVLEPTFMWNQFPIIMQLFHLFWSFNILWDLSMKPIAMLHHMIHASEGIISRGDTWELFTIAEFKA
jgi:hypothetical protein